MPSSEQRRRAALHWGIIGLGKIANDFVLAMAHCRHPNKIVAVSTSNSVERAMQFKLRVGLGAEVRAYGTYQEMMRDSDVDIVYIATLNNTHFELVITALENGKSVLCEKPMVYTGDEIERIKQVQHMINQRDGNSLFVMEAYWSRFWPAWRRIRDIVRSGRLGKPIMISADLSAKLPNSRRELSLGETPLMDIGCYTIMLATFVLDQKKVTDVRAYGQTDVTGVDQWSHLVLHFENGAHACCYSNSLIDSISSASVTFEKGHVELPERFWAPTELREWTDLPIGRRIDQRIEHFPLPDRRTDVQPMPPEAAFFFHNSSGLCYEMDHVWECIEEGETESSMMELEESRKIASILEIARKQLGVELRRPDNGLGQQKQRQLMGQDREDATQQEEDSTQ